MNHNYKQFALIIFRVAAVLIVLHTAYELANVSIHFIFLGISNNVPTALFLIEFSDPIVGAIILWFIAPALAAFVSRNKNENS